MRAARQVIGWDIGGAHVKACLMQDGQVLDVAQWACPLWQGLQQLDAALAQAAQRWPALDDADIIFQAAADAVSVVDGATWVAAEATVIGSVTSRLAAG